MSIEIPAWIIWTLGVVLGIPLILFLVFCLGVGVYVFFQMGKWRGW